MLIALPKDTDRKCRECNRPAGIIDADTAEAFCSTCLVFIANNDDRIEDRRRTVGLFASDRNGFGPESTGYYAARVDA